MGNKKKSENQKKWEIGTYWKSEKVGNRRKKSRKSEKVGNQKKQKI